MSSGQSQKSNIDQSFSFEDVSKLFALPLSEAADILGVATSVLKKICNENGLERWPHRKYLAGKSIEEIKKEAAKEKNKALGGNSPKTTVAVTSAATASPVSHVNKDKNPKSAPEVSKSQSGHQTGSKTTPSWRSHQMIASGLAIETNTLDEFKYGFPSSGLAKCTNKWWESKLDNDDGVSRDHAKPSPEVKDAFKVKVSDSCSSICDEQDEVSSMSDKQNEVSITCVKQDEVSLSAVRKRALEEGKTALKLHALKKYGADKLGSEEKILLRRLYQTY